MKTVRIKIRRIVHKICDNQKDEHTTVERITVTHNATEYNPHS